MVQAVLHNFDNVYINQGVPLNFPIFGFTRKISLNQVLVSHRSPEDYHRGVFLQPLTPHMLQYVVSIFHKTSFFPSWHFIGRK